MSTCRGHADLTPGCTECALAEARAEVERLNGVLHKQATAFFEANAAIAKLDKEADEYGRALEDARALLADSPTAAARQVSAALRERDEARAEVERLRLFEQALQGHRRVIDSLEAEVERLRRDYSALLESYEAQKFGEATVRRIVAERQREACAKSFSLERGDERITKRDAHERVRGTPLVTEAGDK